VAGDDRLAQAVFGTKWSDPQVVDHLVHGAATYHGAWGAHRRATGHRVLWPLPVNS
jgi:hypothetical protein